MLLQLLALLPFASGLVFVKDVPLSGRADRFDYQSVDTVNDRLYIAHMGSGQLIVFDTRAQREIATIGDMPGATGVWAVPELHRVYVSVTGHNHVAVIDDRNQIDPVKNRVAGRFTFRGANHPHGMQVDEKDGLLFVANQGSATLSALDLRTHRLISEHRVGDDPDVLAFDGRTHTLYVAAESGRISLFSVKGKTVKSEGEVRLSHAHTIAAGSRDGLVYVPLQNVGGKPVLRIMRRVVSPDH